MGQLIVALVLSLASAACGGDSASTFTVDGISPAEAVSRTQLSVQIDGTGFSAEVVVDIGSGEATLANPTVRIGGTTVNDVELVSESELRGTLGPDLDPGTYDVVITIAGSSRTLESGLVLLDLGPSSELCRTDPSQCAGGQAGALCSQDSECQGQCCTEEGNCGGGMCTYACENDSDCPSDMACQHSVCFYRCTEDEQCAEGQSCEHMATVCEYP